MLHEHIRMYIAYLLLIPYSQLCNFKISYKISCNIITIWGLILIFKQSLLTLKVFCYAVHACMVHTYVYTYAYASILLLGQVEVLFCILYIFTLRYNKLSYIVHNCWDIERLRVTSFALKPWYFRVAKLWSICMATGRNSPHFC